MHKTLLAAAVAGVMLSACALIPADKPMAEPNPFFVPSALPYQAPPFEHIRDEHFQPALEQGMRRQLAEVQAIAGNPQPPTFENTIAAMERSGQLLDRAMRVFFSLTASHTNDTLTQVQQEMAPRLAAHEDAIFLDDALFARIEKLHAQRETLGLDAESLRLLERYHTNFVRAGARLSPGDKDRLRALNEEQSRLTTQFGNNLRNDTNAAAIVVEDVAELAGLSDDAIAAAAEAAKARGLDGKWIITLQLPTPQPVMATLENRALRERIFRAAINRGNNDNEYNNVALVARLAQLRAERAALLGYATHAHFQLEEQTARTVDTVNELLADLAPAALANARKEATDMQALIRAQGGDFELQPWDWQYYAEQVRKDRYDLDESQLRPYFELNRVLQDGAFYMGKLLYGLSFVERKDIPVYHPDVRVFEVFEEDGTPLGLFYGDYFARDSKRGGAWMNSFVTQSHLMQTQPVVVNVMNIPRPPPGEPALLTFTEVNTLFHEFGHALHGLFSDVRFPTFSATAVPRDFVEFPSQVHEFPALEPQVLANYARHYKTGDPMPQELVDRILAAEQFNQGFATTEYLAASLLDQAWHQLPAGTAIDDVLKFEAAALKAAGMDYHLIPPRYRSTYFNHIYAGGYSAGYYSYIWSEVLDADTVEWFREHGGLTRANGQRFRDTLLSRGGSREALDLFRDFAGREPRIEPLLERRGLARN